ncbi:MAG: hypothetical protein JNK58_07845 [Phycisphaerae bacterium]|nr:hypothetical protein [Phycisphaerae bacterium]
MSPRELEDRLRRTCRAITGWSCAADLACVASIALAALLGIVAFDAARPMPAWARVGVSALWVGAIVLGSARAMWRGYGSAASACAAARLIETRAGIRHNRIINALLLSRVAAAAETPGAGLIARAVDLGSAELAGAEGSVVLGPERRWLRRALAGFAAAAVVLAGAAATAPRVFRAVIPRLVEPFADHPAYSRTDFELSVEPREPSPEDEVRVRVGTSGVKPGRLRLMIREAEMEDRSIPMAETDTRGVFEATLRGVTRPLRLHAEGDTGRSRSVTIVPGSVPRIIEAAATITPPAYTGRAARTIALSPGGTVETLEAPAGSEVGLHVAASMALRAEGIVIQPEGSALAKVTATGRSLGARLTLIGEDAVDVSVRPISTRGTPSAQSLAVRAVPKADQPPVLRLVSPAWSGGELSAPARATIQIDAEARDDFGLRAFGLAYSLFDARGVWRSFGTVMRVRHDQSPILLEGDEPVRLSSRLDLSEVGAEAGGLVLMTLLAVDTRIEPFGPPQSANIGPMVVRLVGPGGASSGGRSEEWIESGGDVPDDASLADAGAAGGIWRSDAPRGPSRSKPNEASPHAAEPADRADSPAAAGDGAPGGTTIQPPVAVQPIEEAGEAPRRADAESTRRSDRAARGGVAAPTDPMRRIPEGYRDVVSRYFRLLNGGADRTSP